MKSIIRCPTQQDAIVDAIDIRILPGKGFRFELMQDFWAFGFCVPKGFIFDGASVPWAMQWVIARLDGQVAEGALLHDWLYRYQTVSRVLADAMLLELLKVRGVVWRKRVAVWVALRLFGWIAWRENGKMLRRTPQASTV